MYLLRRKTVTIVVVVCIVLLVGIVTYPSMRKSRREKQIFCEGGLTEGMSEDDVLIYLSGFEDINHKLFWVEEPHPIGEFEKIYVNYMDKNDHPASRSILFFISEMENIQMWVLYTDIFDFQEFGTIVNVCD